MPQPFDNPEQPRPPERPQASACGSESGHLARAW